MPKRLLIALCAVIAIGTQAHASPIVLAEVHEVSTLGGSGGIPDTTDPELVTGSFGLLHFTGTLIGFGLNHLSGTVGVFDIDDSDPRFDTFVTLITNGFDDGFSTMQRFKNPDGVILGPFFAHPTTESDVFGTMPDLAGFRIDFVRLTINDFVIVNAPFPSVREYDFRADWDITWQVWGREIPEPTTLALFGTAAIALAWRWKRRVAQSLVQRW